MHICPSPSALSPIFLSPRSLARSVTYLAALPASIRGPIRNDSFHELLDRRFRLFLGHTTHPIMNNKLPRLKASANLCGLVARKTGLRKRKAKKKHIADPARHAMNPKSLFGGQVWIDEHALKLTERSGGRERGLTAPSVTG